MGQQLDKIYDPKKYEAKIYNQWEASGSFKPNPDAAKDPNLRKRFEREAQILQKVAHPNFVRFVDYGNGAFEPAYVVMEFLDGSALSKLLSDESRLLPERALHITRHVLTGLSHAHGLGIVHRDVSRKIRSSPRFWISASRAWPSQKTNRRRSSRKEAKFSARRRTWRPNKCAVIRSTRAPICMR